MGKISIGLHGNTYKQRRKQKTINDDKIVVKSTSYYGEFAGWELEVNGEFVQFNNGMKFQKRTDINEAFIWALNCYRRINEYING